MLVFDCYYCCCYQQFHHLQHQQQKDHIQHYCLNLNLNVVVVVVVVVVFVAFVAFVAFDEIDLNCHMHFHNEHCHIVDIVGVVVEQRIVHTDEHIEYVEDFHTHSHFRTHSCFRAALHSRAVHSCCLTTAAEEAEAAARLGYSTKTTKLRLAVVERVQLRLQTDRRATLRTALASDQLLRPQRQSSADSRRRLHFR